MKLFLVPFFVGCVSASLQYAFEQTSNGAIQSFMQGVERFERETKDELKDYARKVFEQVVNVIEGKLKKGMKINEEALKHLKDLQAQIDHLEIDDKDVADFKHNLDQHVIAILREMKILPPKPTSAAESKRDVKDELRDYTRRVLKQVVDGIENALKKGNRNVDVEIYKHLKERQANVDNLHIPDQDVADYKHKLDTYLIGILREFKIIPPKPVSAAESKRDIQDELRDYTRKVLKQVVDVIENALKKGNINVDVEIYKHLKEMQADVDNLQIPDQDVADYKHKLDQYVIGILRDFKILPPKPASAAGF